ncbi:MAG: RIP metalloprotease RseP [Rhodoferax sp.]
MTTVLAFVFALGVLIAVHEWGHYAAARWCGVKVLRFSIGMGPTVWSRVSARTGVEFALGALPLGGYVRMLDEREAPVPLEQLDQAFNRQVLWRRAWIVAAGPLANLALAVLLYALVYVAGTTQAKPVLSGPAPSSLAAAAGLRSADEVVAAAYQGEEWQALESFESLRWWAIRAVMDGRDLALQVRRGAQVVQLQLSTSSLPPGELGPEMLQRLGLTSPWSQAVLGPLVAGDVAERAGLREGDRVLAVDGVPVEDAAGLRQRIRDAGQRSPVPTLRWTFVRAGAQRELDVVPRQEAQGAQMVGRIGAVVGSPVATVLVRHDPWDALVLGGQRTWEVALLTLKTMGRMLVGEASWKQVSGPVSIADYAGRSAAAGGQAFVLFLALMSVSLGVLNLLPVPVLDGGHLMYYLWEAVTGREPSATVLDYLQKAGVAALLALMGVALWNDVARLTTGVG